MITKAVSRDYVCSGSALTSFDPHVRARPPAKRALAKPDDAFDPLDRTRIELMAWPWRCDALGHLNNAQYLHVMHAGRCAWLNRLGLLSQAIRHRISYVIAGAGITYRRQIPRLSRFLLDLRVAGIDERWLCFEYTMSLRTDPGEVVAARGFTRGQLQRRGHGIAPAAAFELLRPGLRVPAPPPSVDFQAFLQSQDAAIRRSR